MNTIIKTKDYTIHFYEKTYNDKLNVVSLVNFLQEIAGDHSTDCGCGREELVKKDLAWILYKWKIKLIRCPEYKEKITIKTWSSSLDGLYADRCFRILDESGNVIGDVLSTWVILNLSQRRVIRIPPEILKLYNEISIGDKVLNESKRVVIPSFSVPPVNTDLYKIRNHDTDENGHVNNAKYLEFALDGYSPEFLSNHEIKLIDILYKKECFLNDTISIERYDSPSDDELSEPDNKAYTTLIKPQNATNKELNCMVKIEWA